MMNNKKKLNIRRYLSWILFVMMFFNSKSVYALNIEEYSTVNFMSSKIDSELQEIMNEAADDELIPVFNN